MHLLEGSLELFITNIYKQIISFREALLMHSALDEAQKEFVYNEMKSKK